MSRIQMSERLRALHRPKDALEQIQRELADHPNSVEAFIELSWIRMALGELGLAREAADGARALAPNNPHVHYAQAVVAGLSGKLRPALEFVKEALALEAEESTFHSYHAALSLGAGRPEEADASSARALELQPGDSYALEVRVRILRALFREDEALAVARQALALHPEHPGLLLHFAELSLEKHDAHAAGSAFRSVLRLDPAQSRAKAGLIDALRARSAVYRGLSGFLRRTERFRARMRRPRSKKILFAVALSFFGLAQITTKGASQLLMIPFVVLLDIALIWFLLYLFVRFVVPIFLVPVFFDSLGKAALKDMFASWWKVSGRTLRHAVMLGAIVGCAFLWPPLFAVIALSLPFYAARQLPAGRSRRIGMGLAALATVFGAVGLIWAWQMNFDGVAGVWLLSAAAVGLSIAGLLAFERRRAAKQG